MLPHHELIAPATLTQCSCITNSLLSRRGGCTCGSHQLLLFGNFISEIQVKTKNAVHSNESHGIFNDQL